MANEMSLDRACAVMDAWLAAKGWPAVYRGLIALYEARLAAENAEEPPVMPSWGEFTGTGEPNFFSKDVCDEYDRAHSIGGRRAA